MKRDTIVFVAITDYDNLGIGYMSAMLSQAGYKTKIIDFRVRKSDLLKTIKKLDPIIIGFSVIFLNHIDHFSGLVKYLRDRGISCHFTAGGHYASLRYESLFQLAPQLDSIIRFEGEYPILELAECISGRQNWKGIQNLVYREDEIITINQVGPPEKDLDKFPYPIRSQPKEYAFGKNYAVILAGRGCTHNCSFCNTREFYRQAKGPLKRIRQPELVVNEMKYLADKKDCSVFIFHDDDFPVTANKTRDWVTKFCAGLKRTGLSKKIIWKINCRTDDVDEKSFSIMKKHGLFLVFLGLEDGTNSGLKSLNKQLNVEDNINAIDTLKKLKIGFDYGFMLFQPSTTFRSLNENLVFLRQVCGDGYTPVTFLRLIPLYETRVESELKESGRLILSERGSDYKFQEESMNSYYDFIMSCIYEWQNSADGVELISKWARNYCLVYIHYFETNEEGAKLCRRIKRIIRDSNRFLLDTMKEVADIFESGSETDKGLFLSDCKKKIDLKHLYFREEIINTMAELVSIVDAECS
jgi:radical SAM superfamily enzyme YgiQ (UPF0313 family)